MPVGLRQVSDRPGSKRSFYHLPACFKPSEQFGGIPHDCSFQLFERICPLLKYHTTQRLPSCSLLFSHLCARVSLLRLRFRVYTG